MNLLKYYEQYPNDFNINYNEKYNLYIVKYRKINLPWNKPYFKLGRGLVLDNTGKIIAHPYEKFFNENQFDDMEDIPQSVKNDTHWENNLPYYITEKVDGSLCTLFNYNNQWLCASTGLIEGDLAKKFHAFLNSKVNLNTALDKYKEYTIELEYVAPDNQIVIKYPQKMMYVHGVIETFTGKNMPFDFVKQIAEHLNLPTVKKYDVLSYEDIERQQHELKNKEGFVVTFSNGKKIKMKTDDYFKKHKNFDKLNQSLATKYNIYNMINMLYNDTWDDFKGMLNKRDDISELDYAIIHKVNELYNYYINRYNELHKQFLQIKKKTKISKDNQLIIGFFNNLSKFDRSLAPNNGGQKLINFLSKRIIQEVQKSFMDELNNEDI